MENQIVKREFTPIFKKTFSLLLSLVMLFSITAGIDLSAFAEEFGDYGYEVLDDGTIRIIRYYGSDSDLNIPSVIDNKTVTIIGGGAFSEAYNAKSISIPDSVISIEAFAFENTGYYKDESNWDNGVLYIGNYLVQTDNVAGAYDIKDGTVLIADGAFNDGEKVTSITLPESVAYVGELSLKCPLLTNIEIDKNNKVFDSRNNCNAIIETKTNTLICGCKNTIIPDSVTSIGSCAFLNCTDLASIVIPSSVKSIERQAFYGCTGLTSITIPEGVASIGDYAFHNCTGLKSVKIPSSMTEIGEDVFWYCTGLEEVIIENGVTSIGRGMFSNCESLTNVTIPGSVKEIKLRAFAECPELQKVTIEKGVQSIAESAFCNCDALKSVIISDNEIDIDSSAFSGCFDIKNVTMPSRYIKSLYTDNLENVTIPDGATEIEEEVFSNLYTLKNITIPDSVTRIENRAFSGCSLANIVIPNNVEYIGDYAFYDCSNMAVDLVIPESVNYIGESAFEGCFYLQNVVVPDSTSVGYRAFKNCPYLTSATVSAHYIDQFDKSILTDITVTGIWIEDNAFRDLDNLRNVTIANSVTSIGDSAFYKCTSLEEVIIPENVTNIGESAFYNCSNLKSVTILSKNCHIASRHEYSNISMEAIPASITIYGYYGTPTQDYARNNRNEFIPLDNTCNHAWNRMEIIKYATCFDEGTMEYTCEWCYSKKTEVIPAKGHTFVTDEAVEPTCTTEGKTEGSHCIGCKAVNIAQKTIPATGHSYDSGRVTKKATCTANGVKTYICTKCKATKTEAVKATGHSFEELELEPPTATTKGIKTYLCSKCDEIKTEIIPALGLKTPTLKVAVNANGSFTLSWNRVSEAENYELYIKNADGSYKLMKTATDTSTKFVTATAAYGKAYSYKIRAIAGNVKSDFSNVVNVTNNKKLQAPMAKAVVNANGGFTISWNAVVGADRYDVYIDNGTGYKLYKTVTGTSVTTGTAHYGKKYSYKVRAVNSKNSAITSVFSSAVTAINNKRLVTPTAKAVVNANGGFTISWNAVSGADKYDVYYDNGTGYKLLRTVTGTSTTTGTAPYGKKYSYKVRAVNSKNSAITSAFSSAVTATNNKKLQTPTMKVTV
ncbi:MAG: leucine-rich repeat protein, partial [Eubacterium sp.]|nr:leucine-rich repeat protein [Eubacterium sp.]